MGVRAQTAKPGGSADLANIMWGVAKLFRNSKYPMGELHIDSQRILYIL